MESSCVKRKRSNEDLQDGPTSDIDEGLLVTMLTTIMTLLTVSSS